MNKMKSLLTTGFVLLTAWLLGQETVGSYSLQQAQEYALKNSAQVKISQQDILYAKQRIKMSTSYGLPNISASGTFNNFIDIPTQVAPADAFSFPDYLMQFLGGVSQSTGVPINVPAGTGSEFQELQFGTKYNVTGGITANQLIFDGSYFVGLRAARAYKDLMEKAKNKSEVDTKQSVSESYYLCLAAEENTRLLEENIANIQQMEKEAKALYTEGLIEEMDADQLTLTLANLESAKTFADQQKEVTYGLLKLNMGMPMAETLVLSDKFDDQIDQAKTNTYLGKAPAINQMADMILLDQQEKMLQMDVKYKRSFQYPKLYGFFNHSQNAYSNEINFKSWYPTTVWGLSLKFDVFSGFRLNAEIGISEIELEKVKIQKDQASMGLNLEYSKINAEYTNAITQLEIQKNNVALATKIKNKTEIKYKEGLASSMDLATAQSQYLTAQGNYINACLSLLTSKNKIEKFINQ